MQIWEEHTNSLWIHNLLAVMLNRPVKYKHINTCKGCTMGAFHPRHSNQLSWLLKWRSLRYRSILLFHPKDLCLNNIKALMAFRASDDFSLPLTKPFHPWLTVYLHGSESLTTDVGDLYIGDEFSSFRGNWISLFFSPGFYMSGTISPAQMSNFLFKSRQVKAVNNKKRCTSRKAVL